jgi:hypothetical protein
MQLPKNIVQSDGTLNDELIVKRENIYRGMNGRFVERFFVTPTKSYVFKPLTNNEQLGKEVWAYEHVLPIFPQIYPRIIANSTSHDPRLNWLIYEDLGTLEHVFNEEHVLRLVNLVAWWHSFPTGKLADIPLKGPKPGIIEVVSEILLKKEEFIGLMPKLQMEEREILPIYSLLVQKEFSNNKVLSHGDLHLGNFAVVNNRIMVLDWEHTHLNSPLWDLYHLIDISHPSFPKTVTNQFRLRILKRYLEQLDLNGMEVNHRDFIQEYYLFSSAFSIWMILLIIKDLHSRDRKWTSKELNRQLLETVACLKQCAAALHEEKGGVQ